MFLTITGALTSSIAAYTPFATISGYTANGNQFIRSVTNKDIIIYNNGSNIMARTSLAAGEDISFSAVLIIK